MEYRIGDLSAMIARYDKVLTDEDLHIIKKDFYLSFDHGYMEKVSVNSIIFIVPKGMEHTLKYYLKNEATDCLNFQKEGRMDAIEMFRHIQNVDDMQILVKICHKRI